MRDLIRVATEATHKALTEHLEDYGYAFAQARVESQHNVGSVTMHFRNQAYEGTLSVVLRYRDFRSDPRWELTDAVSAAC